MVSTKKGERSLLLVGGTGDIGQAIARRCASDFEKIAIWGRNEIAGLKLVGELQDKYDCNAEFFSCDVQMEDNIRRTMLQTESFLGGINSLINAQGSLAGLKTLADTSAEELDSMYRINFRSPLLVMKFALPSLLARKGSVVNIASISGFRATPMCGAYAASKAALIEATRIYAQEQGATLRVNAICPGWVKSRMMDEVLRRFQIGEAEAVRNCPFRRAAMPEEIAEIAAWLCSDAASYVSGAVINVDGGGQP